MAQNYDLIIIGGGIIGNSIAAHLAKANENLKILIINSTHLGTPASIAAAGLLTPFQLNEFENPALKDFCFNSFKYFLNFYKEINSTYPNIDLGFKQTGSLYLIFSSSEIAQKENELKELQNIPSKVSFLNKPEITKHEPMLTKEAIGAYFYPEEGLINNPRFLKTLSLYCLERRIEFLNEAVVEINRKKNKIENITLSNKEIYTANKYILCNGAWINKFLTKIFNLNENVVKAVKGEILQVTSCHPVPQKIIFCKDGYILPRQATSELERSSLLIGSTSEEINNIEQDKNLFQNTVSGVSFLTNLFQKLIPNYKDFYINNMWSGLRPKTKDNLPIIGKVPDIENLFLAGGHYRNGILMGSLTGMIISDLITKNKCEYNIDPFKINRFLEKQSVVSC